MRRRVLWRHFLNELLEPSALPGTDRHQVLALSAAGLVTVPLFAAVLMGWRYLLRPFQSAGWTEQAVLSDQTAFCATSMFVAAVVAALEWDALALSERDCRNFGVLPVPRGLLVRAKLQALATFAGAFVVALNALPAVVHTGFMIAGLPLGLWTIVPLIGAHALSTMSAGAFGFLCVVGLRESLFCSFGPRRFWEFSDTIRSGLLFALLLCVLFVPISLARHTAWILDPDRSPIAARPIAWFVAMHASVAGAVLEAMPSRRLPESMRDEENRLRTQYQRALPVFRRLAWRGAGMLAALCALSIAVYLLSARRVRLLVERTTRAARWPRIAERLARAILRRAPTRAGFFFLYRTVLGSPSHRIYIILSIAVGIAIFFALGPVGVSSLPDGPVPIRTSALVAQTLLLLTILAGFGAAIRTSAGADAQWMFDVTDVGHGHRFRQGIRIGLITVVAATVAVLVPVHTAAWGIGVALVHALNGAAAGWLIVEVSLADVDRPLIVTIATDDALNTGGVVRFTMFVVAAVVNARAERGGLETGRQLAAPAIVLILAGMMYWSNRPAATISSGPMRKEPA